MREARRIRQIKEKAYAGVAGARRKKFCLAYRETFTRIWAKTEEEFASKIAITGDRISCVKGCAYCCSQHISAPAAHSIAVVDFLYSHEPVLQSFLDNYKPWRESAGLLCDEIDAAYNAAIDPSEVNNSGAIGESLSRKYFSRRILCPFLVKSACSIYEIRPVCCAAHRSVTPGEWCDPSDNHDLRTYEAMPGSEDLHALVKLAPLRLSLYHIALPTMVHKLLTQDFSDIMTAIDRRFPHPAKS